MNRILTGLLGFALVGLTPLAASTSADAAAHHGVGVGHVAASSVAQRGALPKREITSKMVQKGTHKIIFKGKVKGDPKYANRWVTIQRRIGKKGSWKFYAKDKSSDLGYWSHEVGAPRTGRWYFRAMTPETNNYARSYSDIWYTYTY